MKIRILHIIKSLGRGGAEMLLPETLRVHDRSKFEFFYIYFLDYKDQMVPDLQSQGVDVQCFNANDNIRIILKLGSVISYIRENEIDMIHCHLPWAGLLGRLIHRRTNIPMVYTEHNNIDRYHPVTKFMVTKTINWQDLVITVSDDSYKSVMKNTKPKISVRTLLNGVNTEEFSREKFDEAALKVSLGLPINKRIVVTVAVFRPQKRLDRWVEVVREVCSRNDDFYFLLVGEGSERDRINELISKYGLAEHVRLTGLMNDTKPFYAVSDIFLMTSDFEGLPVSLLESMSMNCAPICTSVGGITEVIENDKNGILVDVNENVVVELAEAVCGLKDENIDLLSSNARNTIVKNFSMKRMVQELEDIYLTLHAQRS